MSEVKELPKEFQALIKKHLPFYEDLHRGRRRPSTPSQVHFVDVACGRTKKTLTIHERAYMAWLTYKREYAPVIKKVRNKKQRKRKNNRVLSAASVKKNIKEERINKKNRIKTAHRVSGFNEIRAHFVSGGAVRPK